MPIHGSLHEMSVLEVVQLIGTQKKSTTLKIDTPGGGSQLHFRDGMLVAAHRRGSGMGEPFLDAMIAFTHLSPPEAIRIAEQVDVQGRDLWKAVLDTSHLSRETCEKVYMQATEATIDRALLWEQGHFVLLPPVPIETVFSPGLSVDSILLDAMRRLDEVASWKQGPIPPSSVPCLTGAEDLYVSSDPLRRAVVRQVDGRRTAAQIIEATRLGEYDIYSTLGEGIEAGWIEILETGGERKPPPAPPREVLRRWPAVVILAAVLLLGVGSAWIGQWLDTDRGPWVDTHAQWEELDLRRLIEVYRYRHGAYPSDLAELGRESLPAAEGVADRWQVRIDGDTYRLTRR